MVRRHDAHAITSKNSFGGGGINRRKTLEDLVNDALFYTEYSIFFFLPRCKTVVYCMQQIKQTNHNINLQE